MNLHEFSPKNRMFLYSAGMARHSVRTRACKAMAISAAYYPKKYTAYLKNEPFFEFTPYLKHAKLLFAFVL
jgi:hypothetical protein